VVVVTKPPRTRRKRNVHSAKPSTLLDGFLYPIYMH